MIIPCCKTSCVNKKKQKSYQKNYVNDTSYLVWHPERSLAEVRRLLHRWGLEDVDMLICMNGSTLWDNLTKEEETYYKLKKEWIREIIEKMSVFTCNPVIYRNDCIYCKEMDEVVKQSATSAEMEAMEVTDMKVFYQEENAKIMFRVNEEDMLQIEAYLTAHPSKDYHFF